LVRAESRQQELAIHAALGAGSRRIAWELLSESLSLAILGGRLGLGLAYAGIRMLVAKAPAGLPRIGEIGIDPLVLLFTLGISLLAGLLFGLIPVLNLRRPTLRRRSKKEGASRARAASVIAHGMRSLSSRLPSRWCCWSAPD
jgi:putative ABC transport system permease protein